MNILNMIKLNYLVFHFVSYFFYYYYLPLKINKDLQDIKKILIFLILTLSGPVFYILIDIFNL